MRSTLGTLVLLSCLLGSRAHGQTVPDPLSRSGLYAFPGSIAGPGSAISAGLALADARLGDEPFMNAAAAPPRGVAFTPVLLHVSRQDLRAEFHEFDETAAFFDFAGGFASLPMRRLSLSVYAVQPVLRREENAYTRGEAGVFPPPAVVGGQTDSRETRAGLALSTAWRALRIGVAGEWTRRDDSYDFEEKNGVTDPGLHHTDFSGSGVGFQVGFRGERPGPREREGAGAFTAGASFRYQPAITLDVAQKNDLESGSTDSTFTVERSSGWDAGVSARYAVTPAFRVLVSAGGRGRQTWDGFGVASGPGSDWSVGGEFHDARDPWTLRFGIGQEYQTQVPEPRAGMFGLGLGWTLDSIVLDVAALHRTLPRTNEPISYDDRVLVTLRVPF